MAAAAAQNQDFAGVGKSASLTQSLERAHRFAVERSHGVVTLEHLLMALTEDQDASAVFSASPVDLGRLRGDVAEVLMRVPPPDVAGRAILPNADLLRVLRLAATAAQQSQRTAIDGMIVLAAIIGDGKTAGAQILGKNGLTFNEVIRVLQSAAAPRAPAAAQAAQVPPPVVQPPRMVAPPQPPSAPPMPPAPATPQMSHVPVMPPAPAAAPPLPVAPTQAAEAPPPRMQSTEDLLASVRARLQETVPAPQRPASPSPSQAAPSRLQEPPVEAPPAAFQPDDEPLHDSRSQFDAAHEMPVAAPPPAQTSARAAPRLNPAPLPLGRLEQPRGEPDGGGGGAGAAVQNEPSLDRGQPPPSRSGPPPLPTVAPAREAAPKIAEAGPTPPPRGAPMGAAAQPAPAQPLMPGVALPLPTVDLAALADSLPESLTKGVVSIVEVAVPRRVFEMSSPLPQPRPGTWPPMRVATMRLFAQGDNVIVEPLSPPSLWLRIWRGPGDPESVVWRWRVLPRTSGTVGLSLTFGVRTVGQDGVGQEALWPEEAVGVRVRGGRGKRIVVAGLFSLALLAGGYGGLVYAGKADLVAKPVIGLWQTMFGKK